MKTALMVWGASSGAGKSLLATALCRWAAREGLDVAPFKAQNMSNNARVVPLSMPPDANRSASGLEGECGEIGSAQYFQALAARAMPHVDMNPVLLKPERDTASQVVVQGRVDAALSRMPWRERSARLASAARASFERLTARHEVLVIEGAGSPAEINLAPQDYVNLGTARWASEISTLRALLVVDIDRGGAFAHLHGTWALLPDDLRGSVTGFVLNKFRGDATLLAPGPQRLQALTGVPMLGVLPMLRDHGLPEEDGLYGTASGASGGPRVAIVAWPHLSNLDEFQPLAAVASVRWVRTVGELDGADWIVLPGSKQVSGDLVWLQAQGLGRAIVQHARAGRPVLGICGGLQALGTLLGDPDGVDGEAHGPLPGLGLLPLATHYAAPKRLRAAPVQFAELARAVAPWNALSSQRWPAYEIRCGRTQPVDGAALAATPALHDADGQPIGWSAAGDPAQPHRHNVLGIATHGLFEDAAVLRALFGQQVRTLDASFDGLADFIDTHLGAATLRALFHC
ncbi:cobyric acid synthase [Piscinibacter koreensis]|uniref:Cobyric acid synthase n=1 Tax=Piscinibacter koreensis TaxID=2742824 RepID=A0A7Y6NQ97_9BURK|nr:cobyric acid synthase [Schlegelella koreensis]NUZ07377.1 cobyric acid synthase [Schlegelella koreensis]